MMIHALYAASLCCAVVELRQYTLHPGKRDTLIALFEESFIEGQEQYGIRVLGQFRDLGNPDRFVWLRGFDDMRARAVALEGFYSGPIWKQHRERANATMIDSDNVLLLKPAASDTGLPWGASLRARIGEAERPGGAVVTGTVYSLTTPAGAFAAWFRTDVVPALAAAGISVLAQFVTEPAPNSFPRLPVREGENVFVWFARHSDLPAQRAALQKLEQSPAWRTRILPKLRALTKGDPEQLVLAPTQRSLLQ